MRVNEILFKSYTKNLFNDILKEMHSSVIKATHNIKKENAYFLPQHFMAIGIPSIDRWLMYISEDEISLGKQNLASLSYQNYSMILSCENIILRKLLIVVDIKLLLLNDILAIRNFCNLYKNISWDNIWYFICINC